MCLHKNKTIFFIIFFIIFILINLFIFAIKLPATTISTTEAELTSDSVKVPTANHRDCYSKTSENISRHRRQLFALSLKQTSVMWQPETMCIRNQWPEPEHFIWNKCMLTSICVQPQDILHYFCMSTETTPKLNQFQKIVEFSLRKEWLWSV